MELVEFNILCEVYKEGGTDPLKIAVKTGCNLNQVSGTIVRLQEKGWIDSGITEQGYKELQQYKVDNAIIMAAGFGLRSLPLSRIVPKGLYDTKILVFT